MCFSVNFAKYLRTSFFNRTPLVAASGHSPWGKGGIIFSEPAWDCYSFLEMGKLS